MKQTGSKVHKELSNLQFSGPQRVKRHSAEAAERAIHQLNAQTKITEAQWKRSGYMDLSNTCIPTSSPSNGPTHASTTDKIAEPVVSVTEQGTHGVSNTLASRSQDVKSNRKHVPHQPPTVTLDDDSDDNIVYWKAGLEAAKNKRALVKLEQRLVLLESKITSLEAENVELRTTVLKINRHNGN